VNSLNSIGPSIAKSSRRSPGCWTTWWRSNGLPLEQQRGEILRKRRHGMASSALGSTLTCSGNTLARIGEFTENVSREMAVAGWEAAWTAPRRACAIMNEEFHGPKEMLRERPE